LRWDEGPIRAAGISGIDNIGYGMISATALVRDDDAGICNGNFLIIYIQVFIYAGI
jgi:hypothetical protein